MYKNQNNERILGPVDRLNIPPIVSDTEWIFLDYLKYAYTCIMENGYSIITTDKIENNTRSN